MFQVYHFLRVDGLGHAVPRADIAFQTSVASELWIRRALDVRGKPLADKHVCVNVFLARRFGAFDAE